MGLPVMAFGIPSRTSAPYGLEVHLVAREERAHGQPRRHLRRQAPRTARRRGPRHVAQHRLGGHQGAVGGVALKVRHALKDA